MSEEKASDSSTLTITEHLGELRVRLTAFLEHRRVEQNQGIRYLRAAAPYPVRKPVSFALGGIDGTDKGREDVKVLIRQCGLSGRFQCLHLEVLGNQG